MGMEFASLETLIEDLRANGPQGPSAIILAEDDVLLEETLAHHQAIGFRTLIVLAAPAVRVADSAAPAVLVAPFEFRRDNFAEAVSKIVAALNGTWVYYGFNAEFLFYPFAETRSVSELCAFHTEERRSAFFTTVVDLYAGDLSACPDGVDKLNPSFDRMGYYALGREDPAQPGVKRERQIDLYGGLRWRFEQEVPWTKRRIDRIALFKAQQGLKVLPDHRLSEEEMNTLSCPWHHNVTLAVASFRTAKALTQNPASARQVSSFVWAGSQGFGWTAQEFLELGLIEPGQWF